MVHRAWWSTESKAALRLTAIYRWWSLQNSCFFSTVCLTTEIWSIVEQSGMKPACCYVYLWWIAGRTQVRRMWVNNLPSIESSVMPQWLMQISWSPLCFQNDNFTPCLQPLGSSSLILTSLIIWTSQQVRLAPPALRSSAMMEQTPGLWPYFKCFRVAATSASVMGCIQVSA